MKILYCAALAAGLFASGARAQTPPSEMPSEMPAEQPAVAAPAPRKPAPANPAASAPAEAPVVQAPGGTTIVGEQESPIGLYIMPWRNSQAEGGLDRPARLLDDSLMTLDRSRRLPPAGALQPGAVGRPAQVRPRHAVAMTLHSIHIKKVFPWI
jgi:hypothetical protein